LESWGKVETEHAAALASTIGCTRAAVCRISLTNGAKVFGFRLILYKFHMKFLLHMEMHFNNEFLFFCKIFFLSLVKYIKNSPEVYQKYAFYS